MEASLQQRQSQKQALAPQMRQGLRLLALNLPDLRRELMQEMAMNPVIDDVEPTLEKSTVSEKERESAAEAVVSDYPEDDFDARNTADTSAPDAEALERRQKFFENQVGTETLEHHLMAQMPSSDIPESDWPLAETLIGELNDDGRFIGSLPDIRMVSGETEEKIRFVLAQIRDFDPPGCGATTVRECLEAQLDKIENANLRRRVAKLLENLEDVAAGKVDDAEAFAALRTLDPRPGRAYRRDARGTEYVNPEVHAVRCADGWAAQVDARSLPEIKISQKYLNMLADPNVSAEAKTYVRERIAAVKSLVESVANRRDTIESIAQEIFDRQPDFFVRGLKGLKPMTMQEVADALELNVSTVSRTVNGKYASTPKGTVELARFFTHGIVMDSGETVTQKEIVDHLREIIAKEDKRFPLSDEKLSTLLKDEGFPVARRTVAKYRSLAGIPGACDRRSAD